MEFPFNEPENLPVFTCKHILEDGADICYTSHDEDDGAWQFLCGSDIHTVADGRLVALKEILNLDHSIAQLADMPLGCGALREKKGRSWQRFKK